MIVKVKYFYIIVIYCFVTFLAYPVAAENISYDEYALKTAFLYRSLHYIEWLSIPDNNPDTVLTICLAHNDAFGNTISSLHNKSVDQHKINIKKFVDYTQMKNCHVVYISKTADSEVIQIFANKNILTVSDYPGFIEAGGILNFPLQKQNVAIEINHSLALKHNLKISAKLLRIATVKNAKSKSIKP